MADVTVGAARVVDETLVNTMNLIRGENRAEELVTSGGILDNSPVTDSGIKNIVHNIIHQKKELNIDGSGVPKGTGKTIGDYLDGIVNAGSVNATKMNKLKNAIQNNIFSIEELSKISKKMAELGITKEYNEALIKIDFGKYLRGLIGDPPDAMINPHAHHILFKKGLGQKQQELVREGQEILRKYNIDPLIGKENLVWAPFRVAGQHGITALEKVVNQLKEVDAAGADLDDIIEILEDLGKQAASRK